jgi:hypothetical protein
MSEVAAGKKAGELKRSAGSIIVGRCVEERMIHEIDPGGESDAQES